MYNDIFAIDEVPFNERLELKEQVHPYLLNNYSFFGSKLDKELYYTYFLKTILFDVDIMELEDFFNFQYKHSRNPNKFLKLIDLKVIPDIDKINSNSGIDGRSLEYRNEINLKYGFVETEGIIKNKSFDIRTFYSLTAGRGLKENNFKRKDMLENIIINSKVQHNKINSEKLVWVGKPSHLGFIIRKLIDEGYIDAPIKHNNEINLSQLAKQLMNTFHIENGTTENTLMKYLNPNSEKHQALAENFSEQEFQIPNSGLMG